MDWKLLYWNLNLLFGFLTLLIHCFGSSYGVPISFEDSSYNSELLLNNPSNDLLLSAFDDLFSSPLVRTHRQTPSNTNSTTTSTTPKDITTTLTTKEIDDLGLTSTIKRETQDEFPTSTSKDTQQDSTQKQSSESEHTTIPDDFTDDNVGQSSTIISTSTAILNSSPSTTTSTTTTSVSPQLIQSRTGLSSNSIEIESTRNTRQGFMSGNTMLDRLMNCPCTQESLTAIGVKPVQSSSNQPSPNIYRAPPYGPNALGPGDVIASNLKSVGGTTGTVFGQLIRLILGLPNLLLSLLKPLVVGAADTAAQTTDALAGVTKQAATSLPVAVRSGAMVLRRLLESVGDVVGGLLHVASNLAFSLAAAKTSLVGTLPFAFDIVGDVSGRASSAIGYGVDFLSGTREIVADGVVNAAKTSANIFSGLVEGSKGFGTGLLDGIKYGVQDDQSILGPPTDEIKK